MPTLYAWDEPIVAVEKEEKRMKLYICDPIRNTACPKTNCVHDPLIKDGLCAHTTDAACAVVNAFGRAMEAVPGVIGADGRLMPEEDMSSIRQDRFAVILDGAPPCLARMVDLETGVFHLARVVPKAMWNDYYNKRWRVNALEVEEVYSETT